MNIIDLKMKLKTISDVMNQNKQYLVELISLMVMEILGFL